MGWGGVGWGGVGWGGGGGGGGVVPCPKKEISCPFVVLVGGGGYFSGKPQLVVWVGDLRIRSEGIFRVFWGHAWDDFTLCRDLEIHPRPPCR